MAKRGRKCLAEKWLSKDNLILLQGWAREGLTDEQIAHNMGIHVGTLYEYKKKYREIDEALKKGKEVIDFIVENALIKKALGFTEKVDGKLVYYPPDTTAIIFWLNNRKPDRYRRNWNREETAKQAQTHKEFIDKEKL